MEGLGIWRCNFINENAVHLYAHYVLLQCVPFIAHRSSELGGGGGEGEEEINLQRIAIS